MNLNFQHKFVRSSRMRLRTKNSTWSQLVSTCHKWNLSFFGTIKNIKLFILLTKQIFRHVISLSMIPKESILCIFLAGTPVYLSLGFKGLLKHCPVTILLYFILNQKSLGVFTSSPSKLQLSNIFIIPHMYLKLKSRLNNTFNVADEETNIGFRDNPEYFVSAHQIWSSFQTTQLIVIRFFVTILNRSESRA